MRSPSGSMTGVGEAKLFFWFRRVVLSMKKTSASVSSFPVPVS